MNNVLTDVKELKELIISSDEYKNYIMYLHILENSDDINLLIKNITSKQKEIVKLEHLNKKDLIKEKELDCLYTKLNQYEEYRKYIKSSKKLNDLISNVQKKFQEYFDSLVC